MGAQQLVSLKGEMLKEIGNMNSTSAIIAKVLSERQRMRHFTDYRRMMTEMKRDGHRINDAEFIEFWEKTLPGKGLGVVAYGRKLKDGTITPDKFGWYYNLKEVAKSMITGADIKLFKVENPFKEANYPEVPEVSKRKDVKLRKAAKNLTVAPTPQAEPAPEVVQSEATVSGKQIYVFLPSGNKVSLNLSEDDTKALVAALNDTLSN